MEELLWFLFMAAAIVTGAIIFFGMFGSKSRITIGEVAAGAGAAARSSLGGIPAIARECAA